jgi:hypothetical protein
LVARVGRSTRQAEGRLDWERLDWVRIPAEVILPAQSNPTGSAVICHSGTFGGVVPEAVTVWCYGELSQCLLRPVPTSWRKRPWMLITSMAASLVVLGWA